MRAEPRHPVVLVVEDDPNIQQLLRRTLQAHDFGVVVAANVGEALQRAEATACDAVILDLTLGTESGIDVLASLRLQPPYASTPVLILTGRVDLAEDQEALIRRHRACVFFKPQPYSELIGHLRRLTHHHPAAS